MSCADGITRIVPIGASGSAGSYAHSIIRLAVVAEDRPGCQAASSMLILLIHRAAALDAR